MVIRLRELAPYTIWQNDLRAQFCPPPLTKPTHCTSALDCPSVCTMGWHPCWRKFSWTNFFWIIQITKVLKINMKYEDRIVHEIGMLLQKQFHPIAHGTYYGHLMLCFTRCSIILPKFVTAIRKTSGRLRYNLVSTHWKWSKTLIEAALLLRQPNEFTKHFPLISILLRIKTCLLNLSKYKNSNVNL